MCGFKTVVGDGRRAWSGQPGHHGAGGAAPGSRHATKAAKACIESGLLVDHVRRVARMPIDENLEKTAELRQASRPKRACRWKPKSAPSAAKRTVWSACGEMCRSGRMQHASADLGVDDAGGRDRQHPRRISGKLARSVAWTRWRRCRRKTGDHAAGAARRHRHPGRDRIKNAISLGVSKINVNTECQLASSPRRPASTIEEGKDLQGKGLRPTESSSAPGFEAIKATVKEKMELFGSVNKA